ncbi:unnamed protein product [Ixodes persulcatus]
MTVPVPLRNRKFRGYLRDAVLLQAPLRASKAGDAIQGGAVAQPRRRVRVPNKRSLFARERGDRLNIP